MNEEFKMIQPLQEENFLLRKRNVSNYQDNIQVLNAFFPPTYDNIQNKIQNQGSLEEANHHLGATNQNNSNIYGSEFDPNALVLPDNGISRHYLETFVSNTASNVSVSPSSENFSSSNMTWNTDGDFNGDAIYSSLGSELNNNGRHFRNSIDIGNGINYSSSYEFCPPNSAPSMSAPSMSAPSMSAPSMSAPSMSAPNGLLRLNSTGSFDSSFNYLMSEDFNVIETGPSTNFVNSFTTNSSRTASSSSQAPFTNNSLTTCNGLSRNNSCNSSATIQDLYSDYTTAVSTPGDGQFNHLLKDNNESSSYVSFKTPQQGAAVQSLGEASLVLAVNDMHIGPEANMSAQSQVTLKDNEFFSTKNGAQDNFQMVNYSMNDMRASIDSSSKISSSPSSSSATTIVKDKAISVEMMIKSDPKVWGVVVNKYSRKKGAYKCTHCSESFKTLESSITHIDIYNLAENRRFKCEFEDCPWKYIGLPRMAELKRHMQSLHNYDFKSAKSPSQKKDFTYNGLLSGYSPTSEGATCLHTYNDIQSQEYLSGLVASSSSATQTDINSIGLERPNVVELNSVKVFDSLSKPTLTKVNGNKSARDKAKHKFCCEVMPDYCEKSFPRKDSLSRHIKLCHQQPQSRFNKSLAKKLGKIQKSAK